MKTTESDNLFEIWDKLCELIDQKGSVVQLDPDKKSSEQVKFNQIKLNRESILWQSMMEILAPLSEEEIEVLLDLATPNNTHAVYQSKVSIALLVSIPIGFLYFLNLLNENFHFGENKILTNALIGGLIGGGIVILFLGGYLLYKQLSYRWLSMELTTCLETTLAMKKAQRIHFKKYKLPQAEEEKSKIILKKKTINVRSKK